MSRVLAEKTPKKANIVDWVCETGVQTVLVILLSYARNTWVLSKNVSYVLTI
jgi:hypothetical protein